jgi:HPt (histidine-containing phosphotransfer) domain-containing protein
LDRHLGAQGSVPPPALRSDHPALELDPEVERSSKLCSLFITHAPRTLKALDAALAAESADEAGASAHKLKGSCLALGAGVMAGTAAAAQKAAESQELDAARQHAVELRMQLSRVLDLLQRELAGNHVASAATNGSSPPPAEVRT